MHRRSGLTIQITQIRRYRLHRLFFWLILIIGVGLRLYHVWTAPYAYANSDTCTIWLMARHILQGEFPLFFYGQYYLGPLEPLTIAFFFLLFGIKVSTLYLGMIFYSTLFIVSSYLLGKELKDRRVGLLMMLFSALPPSYFFWESISPLGYHIEILFLGNIIFILTLRNNVRPIYRYTLLGLFSGIGVWTHYIILYYLVPVALYLVINERWKSLLKHSIPAAISFSLIGLPFWIFTFRYNFATFRFKSQPGTPGSMLVFLKLFIQHLNYMFNINTIILWIYIISILYFILISFFKRKNLLLVFFFIFIILFYVGFRSRIYAGEGYNYIIPIFTFISAAFGYLGSRAVGMCLAVFVLSFNTWNISVFMKEQRVRSDSYKQIIYDKISFLEENRISRFIGHEGYSRVPVFFSNERIIATGFTECRYPPYEYIVEASPRIAFEETVDNWRPALDNICSSYDFQRELFYNFKPHPYKTRQIKLRSEYASDRNYNTFWKGRDFVMDLGKIYTVCKIEIYNGHRYAKTPSSCKVQTSIDGVEWLDTAYIENVQPLFWSGPRPYWHAMDGRVEWFFEPISARFIKLVQMNKKLWEINEIFIYEYIGEEVFRIRDYVKNAVEIVRFLAKKGIRFVYTDFWLSAKIKEISKDKIGVLLPYNTYLPPRKNMEREIKLGRDRAFVIRKGDSLEFESILNEFGLSFKNLEFNNYICYYLPDLPREYESMSSLIWIGIGMIKHSLKDYSNWLYKQGEYEKALRYYPNNFMAYLKSKMLPKTRFYPTTERYISFENKIRFIGYSIRNKKIVPGKQIRIEYFWEVKGELEDDLSMFVHFMLGDKIIFQNDHRLLYQYPRPIRPLEGERFREVLKLKIPEDIQPGIYEIVIGLWDSRRQRRFLIIDPVGKKKTKEKIGEYKVDFQ